MKKGLALLIIGFIFCLQIVIAQNDLNSISGSGFNIVTSHTPQNAPETTAILGIQSQWDANYKWQLVNSYPTDNYYLRRHNLTWGNWYKIWHSGNINPYSTDNVETNLENFQVFNGQWRATYPNNNTLGYIYYQGINFGYNVNNYVSLANGAGHNELFFGRWDFGWKGWNKIWHSNNLNRIDVDFYAKSITVAGNISAREINVAANAGADFVFADDYSLRPLNEVETFIKDNRHLPDIAPADSMVQNGVNMGEMQIRLLQKIEELTLYVIELEKKNEAQQKAYHLEIEALKNEIDKIKDDE